MNKNILNPHIPKYIVKKPWYESQDTDDELHHQRQKKSIKKKIPISKWYKKGKKNIVFQSHKFRKGACKNCGAMDHDAKNCFEKARRRGAKLTNKNIAPDREVEKLDLDFEAKKDQWASYDINEYNKVIERYKILENERKKVLIEQMYVDGIAVDDEDKKQDDESAEVFSSGAHGAKTRTSSKNLRIREDVAKYLMDISEDAPFYDPKTRSMRGNPNRDNPDAEYQGDNMYRRTGDYHKFMETNMFAREAEMRGRKMQVLSDPSKTELSHRDYLKKKQTMLEESRNKILQKYGAEEVDESLKKMLFDDEKAKAEQFEKIKKKINENTVVMSRYNEDVLRNGHTEIYGSYWEDGKWGYACCKKLEKHCECSLLKKRNENNLLGDVESKKQKIKLLTF